MWHPSPDKPHGRGREAAGGEERGNSPLGAARDAAGASARTLQHGGGLLFDTAALPPDSIVGSGLTGVETWPDVLTPEERDAAVRALPVFIDKAGTGGAMFRQLRTDFCAEVARLTGDAAFAACRRCSHAWLQLARTCRESPEDHRAIAHAARALPALERAAAQALERAGDPNRAPVRAPPTAVRADRCRFIRGRVSRGGVLR